MDLGLLFTGTNTTVREQVALAQQAEASGFSTVYMAEVYRGAWVPLTAMAAATREGFMEATDLADYLVGKGMPFREAHGIMRELSRHCDERNVSLQDLPLDEYKKFSGQFERDVYDITAESSAAARDNPGGTAPVRVAAALEEAKKILEDAADGF